MQNRLTRLNLLEPMVASELPEGLAELPAALPVAPRGGLLFDGPPPTGAAVEQMAKDEGQMRKLMHITPAIRAELVEKFSDFFTAGPPERFKLTPRNSWLPAQGSLVFRNAALVSVEKNAAEFGWMVHTSTGDILPGEMPAEGAAVDIWVLPEPDIWNVLIIQAAASSTYVERRSSPPDPGAAYTITGFDGATQSASITGSGTTIPIIFKPAAFGWRRCRVAGRGWPWRFWSAEMLFTSS
jgi:hypothetical protein